MASRSMAAGQQKHVLTDRTGQLQGDTQLGGVTQAGQSFLASRAMAAGQQKHAQTDRKSQLQARQGARHLSEVIQAGQGVLLLAGLALNGCRTAQQQLRTTARHLKS
jgi:hypothetical protein